MCTDLSLYYSFDTGSVWGEEYRAVIGVQMASAYVYLFDAAVVWMDCKSCDDYAFPDLFAVDFGSDGCDA